MMERDSYKKIIKNFSILLGYIDIATTFDSFSDVKQDYEKIRDQILIWVHDYSVSKNFDHISSEESYRIHEKLDEIKEKKLFDKKTGNESILTDDILIWYEVIIKNINEER